MKKKKKLYIYIGIAVAILLIVGVIVKKNNKEVTRVSTEKASLRTITQTVTANGKIQPETDIKISPYISGEVVELMVKEGDMVSKGDLLAKIDPEIYISTLQQNEAQLNGQKASLANARAQKAQVEARFKNAEIQFNRNKSLYEQKVISEQDFETAKTNYDVAKADLEAARQSVKGAEYSVSSMEAALKKSRDDLTRTAVFAPADGKVSKLSVEKGERVQGASQFSSGTELMRIANLNAMEARVEVNENDIVKVKLGDTALVEVDAYLNRKFKGVVTQIATSANSSATSGASLDQVTNFEVRIHLLKESYADLIPADRPDYSPFRPGMSANVDIRTNTVSNVVAVPIQSVTTRADTNSRFGNLAKKEKSDQKNANNLDQSEEKQKQETFIEYVFVYDKESVKLRQVKSGIQDNDWIQIISGLKEGEEIVSAPYLAISRDLKNGQKVQKEEKDKLYEKKD